MRSFIKFMFFTVISIASHAQNNTIIGSNTANGSNDSNNIGSCYGTNSNVTIESNGDGTNHSKEVKVDLSNWPDYVLVKDYNLPRLKEIEDYIKKFGYLPNIPSAKVVDQNGIQLGERNGKLL